MEHVGAAAKQPVGYPDIHGGAQKPAGPLVYSLEPHQKEKKKVMRSNERNVYKQTESSTNGLYLEGHVEGLEVAVHLFQLHEARGVDGVPVREGGRRHHAADTSRQGNS